MPKYDIRCGQGHDHEVIRAWDDRHTPCPTCGEPTERMWMTSFPNIINDDVPGGFTIHNMTATPETFYSKSEHRRRMKELGLENVVRHVGHDGGDKSPHTTRWI